MVKDLMKKAGVAPDEIDKYADRIYDAIVEFIQNTGFSVPVHRPKY
jgi:hypothetical protein